MFITLDPEDNRYSRLVHRLGESCRRPIALSGEVREFKTDRRFYLRRRINTAS